MNYKPWRDMTKEEKAIKKWVDKGCPYKDGFVNAAYIVKDFMNNVLSGLPQKKVIMKTYYIDIDNTICNSPTGESPDYSEATPIKKNIKIFNKLYDKGHRINYWSSRGMGTGIDWLSVTLEQFAEWGVKYRSVSLNKPVYDEYVGDKCTNIKDFVHDK